MYFGNETDSNNNTSMKTKPITNGSLDNNESIYSNKAVSFPLLSQVKQRNGVPRDDFSQVVSQST
jgi:hypothetical protein